MTRLPTVAVMIAVAPEEGPAIVVTIFALVETIVAVTIAVAVAVIAVVISVAIAVIPGSAITVVAVSITIVPQLLCQINRNMVPP